MKRIFSRSNVNEKTVQMTDPLRSGFDLSHRSDLSLPLGKYVCANVEKLMPNTLASGSLRPQLQFEKLITPAMGRTRLDTHTFAVAERRINKDFRAFFEGSSSQAGRNLPTFDVTECFGLMLDAIYSDFGTTSSGFLMYWREAATASLTAFTSDTPQLYFCKQIKQRAVDFFRSLLTSEDSNADYCYNRDFFAVMSRRIIDYPLPELVASPAEVASDERDTIVDAAWLPNFIHYLMQPFFGEGSNLDLCGYPCFKRRGVGMMRWIAFQRGSGSSFTGDPLGSQSYYLSWNDFVLSIIPQVSMDHNALFSFEFSLTPGTVIFEHYPIVKSESYLRAVYAAWYDGLRNWHVEKRESLLDPDLFDSNSILDPGFFRIFDLRKFNEFTALFVPRYACYSRDFFTTVQTSDIYREVYAPVLDSTDNEYDTMNDPDNLADRLLKLTIDGVETMFPSGLFRPSGSSSFVNTLKADLQTMRRAGMLEKWLMRNYLFPDTYIGQIMAHYGTRPVDFAVISSDYIGGSETIITGDQVVTATGTEDTPAGTRTITAQGETQDEFSYSTGGDFVYLVSFVSLVPLVTYDCANMHLHEYSRDQFPYPEFASDARVAVCSRDLIREFDSLAPDIIGYVPRYYGFRVRGDEAHSDYLDGKRAFLWLRDYYSYMVQHRNSSLFDTGAFRIDAYNLHIHQDLSAFLGLAQYDNIAYGPVDIQMSVDCPLPAAIEFC